MAALTTQEKLDKIKDAWYKDESNDLIFQWVKTGVLSLSEYKFAVELCMNLHDDLNADMYGLPS